jgi:hypothetical protein
MPRSLARGHIGEQFCLTRVAHANRLGRRGKRHLIVGAFCAENVPAVAAVVFSKRWRGGEEQGWRKKEVGPRTALAERQLHRVPAFDAKGALTHFAFHNLGIIKPLLHGEVW